MSEHLPSFVVAVVDDDERVLHSLRNLLESADYSVRLFTSARAMLAGTQLSALDCLISDIGMPEMDGFELLKTVHAARPDLPVILITGYGTPPSRSAQAKTGQYRLFRKPFKGEELLAAVREAQRVRKSAAP